MSKISDKAEKNIKERVERRERILGRELEPEEIRKIRNNEIKGTREDQIRKRSKIVGIFFALLASIGIRSENKKLDIWE